MEKNLAYWLELAIQNEINSYELYTSLAGKVKEQVAKETLSFLADEEKKHKEILESYRSGNLKNTLKLEQVVDYKIAEHEEKPVLSENSETKDVYLFAAHEELNAYNLYTMLAEIHADGEAKELLLKIANEEKKHKEKVEYYYTNSAFPQNAGG